MNENEPLKILGIPVYIDRNAEPTTRQAQIFDLDTLTLYGGGNQRGRQLRAFQKDFIEHLQRAECPTCYVDPATSIDSEPTPEPWAMPQRFTTAEAIRQAFDLARPYADPLPLAPEPEATDPE